MNARRRIAAHGLALALGLASVAAGQSGPVEATRDASPLRPLGWTTVFAAPPLRTPVSLTLLAARERIAADPGGRRDPAAPRTVPVAARPPPPPTLAPRRVAALTCSVVLSAVQVRGTYEITVDASRSATGTSGVAPSVTVALRDGTGAGVEPRLTLDRRLKGTLTVLRPGIYRATATVSTPQAVDAEAYRDAGTATCGASVTVETPVRRAAIFFDVLGGTERRVRPIEDTDRAFAVGSPLVALKFGVARRFRSHWEVAGSLGAAINLFTGEQKVNGSSVFAEVEANRYLARGSFIGTGLSLWDLTRSNMWTPAWLLHFGIPLSRSTRYAVFFIGEGRLFLAHIGDVTGNYEIWGGVQVRLRR